MATEVLGKEMFGIIEHDFNFSVVRTMGGVHSFVQYRLDDLVLCGKEVHVKLGSKKVASSVSSLPLTYERLVDLQPSEELKEELRQLTLARQAA